MNATHVPAVTNHSEKPTFAVVSICYVALCILLLVDAWRLLEAVAASSPGTPGIGIDKSVVGVSFIALLYLGWKAHRSNNAGVGIAFLIGSNCGALFFASSLGSALVDPQSIDWLLRGDWATHYAGWAMFRKTPWAWPPGILPTLMYPVGTAVIYTDSLPLLALLFKPFSAWLPEPFQYTGGWFVVSCVLQGGFAALLVQRWTRNATLILGATALFLYAPVLLNRLPHATLTAQWLILASLWLYFRPQPPRSIVREAWPWWFLGAFSALVMPYLAMMAFAIMGSYWTRRVWVDRERSVVEGAFAVGIAMLLMMALWWLSGALIIRYQDGGGGTVYGMYSFNLLGFVNSFGLSRLLPMLPVVAPQQTEGFSYLGLGVLSLLAVLAVEGVVRRRLPSWPRQHWPLFAVTLLLVAYAASTVLTMGSLKLIDHPLATPILATFRSSGRFIWVAYYLITLSAIVLTVNRFPAKVSAVLITGAFALQAWDFSDAHLLYANVRSGAGWPKPEQQLVDAHWDQLAAGRHHLTLIPPASCGVQPGSYLPFELLAARHAMSLNTAYVARWNPGANAQYCERLVAQLADGTLSSDDLYIVAEDWRERFEKGGQMSHCESLEGFRTCVIDPDSVASDGRGKK